MRSMFVEVGWLGHSEHAPANDLKCLHIETNPCRRAFAEGLLDPISCIKLMLTDLSVQARGAPQSDTDALARFLSQQGASGLNNLGGRPL